MPQERRKSYRQIHWELVFGFMSVVGTIVGVAYNQSAVDTKQTESIEALQGTMAAVDAKLDRINEHLDQTDRRGVANDERINGLERSVYGPRSYPRTPTTN